MNAEYREVVDKFIFTVKKEFYYTKDDVWIHFHDGMAKIGVTDFLQRRGGDAVFVELTERGRNVRRLEEVANFETIKAIVSVTSPFSGVIVEVNTTLDDRPELINTDPYGEGWLVFIDPSNPEEDEKYLMTAEGYFELMKLKIQDEQKSSTNEA